MLWLGNLFTSDMRDLNVGAELQRINLNIAQSAAVPPATRFSSGTDLT